MKRIPYILTAVVSPLAFAAEPPVVSTAAEAPAADIKTLPEAQQRLVAGLLLLQKLYVVMAEVTNNDTAEAAVPKILKLNEEIRQWAHSFTNLPPLSEPEVVAYEERFLPTIRKINSALEAQASRIAAAEYYGSRNLPAALVRIAQIGHP